MKFGSGAIAPLPICHCFSVLKLELYRWSQTLVFDLEVLALQVGSHKLNDHRLYSLYAYPDAYCS